MKRFFVTAIASIIIFLFTSCSYQSNLTHPTEQRKESTVHTSQKQEQTAIVSPKSSTQPTGKKINTKRALTLEEAKALKGTGYHDTDPNSVAESIEIKAAMVTCKKCGMHSNNGKNSLCDECMYNQQYGLD